MNRALFAGTLGLGLTGGLAAALLVAPLVGGYLAYGPLAGDAAMSRTAAPLVHVRYLPPQMALLHVLRDGKPAELLLHIDPECPRPPGWV